MKIKPTFLIQISFLTIAILFKINAYGQTFSFHTFTNQNYINDIKIFNDTLWVATSGGVLEKPLKSNLVRSYTTNSGLGDNNIRKIFIDNEGVKWFSTFNAISKISKHAIENYEIPKEYVLNGLFSFGKSVDGKQWLGTNGGEELVMIDNGDTTKVPSDTFTTSVVRDIERGDESLWFSTLAGAYRYNDGEWLNLTDADGLPDNTINGIAVANDSNVWIGTSGGLANYNNGVVTSFTIGNSGIADNYIIDVAFANNQIWLALWNKLSYLDAGTWRNVDFLNPSSIAVTEAGEVYVGTGGSGISIIGENGVQETFMQPVTIPHYHIEDIISDLDGNIWIATRGGVAKYDGMGFTLYYNSDGLPRDYVFDLEVGSDNNIWAGTSNGIAKFDGTTWETISTEDVRAIVSSDNGTIWFGTIGNGLFKYDGTITQFTTDDGLISNSVTSMVIDENDVLWIGTNLGLSFYDGNFDSRLSSTFIESLAIDSANRVWAGSFDEGIYILENGNITLNLTQSNLFEGHFIRDISFVESDVYCTTSKGLGVYSKGKWSTYSLEDGMPRNITSIHNSGTDLWVGSSGGLSYTKIETNLAPTDITLVNDMFDVETETPAKVSGLVTVDANKFDFHSYEIVEEAGTNPEIFSIIEGELWITSSISELLENTQVKVKATDLSGGVIEKVLTINFVDSENDIPVITNYNGQISIEEESNLTLSIEDFEVTDPDNAFPDDFTLIINDSANYTVNNSEIIPDVDFNGMLEIPVAVNDDENSSSSFTVSVEVTAVNDIPKIVEQTTALATEEEAPIEISPEYLSVINLDVTYPDGFSITIYEGNNYTINASSITPIDDFAGQLEVPVSVNDGEDESNIFNLVIEVQKVLSVSTKYSSNTIEVYPNPFENTLFIKSNKNVIGLSLIVFDLTGKIVAVKNLKDSKIDRDGSVEVGLNYLVTGSYIAIIYDGNGIISLQQIIKNR